MGDKSRDIELADIILKYAAAIGAAVWILVTGKDLVEARKNEGDRAHTETLTIQEQWKLRPRGVASITPISAAEDPWVTDKQLCSITGSYSLKNVGGAPIHIRTLTFKVYELPLIGPPAPDKQVVSFSTNTRMVDAKEIFTESLPDSDGNLLPDESYSRDFGFTMRRASRSQRSERASEIAHNPRSSAARRRPIARPRKNLPRRLSANRRGLRCQRGAASARTSRMTASSESRAPSAATIKWS